MGMNPETGDLRELLNKKDLKEGEVLFTIGELISLKGCIFKVEKIYPNPDNTLVLKGMGIKAQEANMI